ncbi:MAG: DUF11 domain-containing protein [Planctomycetaceae bacterium]|nr:DUF11 domain-containing protein [Planctomycetaceae bacterium]
MTRKQKHLSGFLAGITVIGSLVFGGANSQAQDGFDRLLKRASLPEKLSTPVAPRADNQLPLKMITSDAIVPGISVATQITTEINPALNNSATLVAAENDLPRPALNRFYPKPIGYGMVYRGNKSTQETSKFSTPGFNGWNPKANRDEYVFDGSDRGVKVTIGDDLIIQGLETEDTVGHFETVDGQRLVTPSNRVAIYAPRFGAVRRLDGVFNARLRQPIGSIEEKTPIAMANGNNETATSNQHVALDQFENSKRASEFIDRTRGVLADNIVHLLGTRNSFKAYENLSLIRLGKHSNSESARLDLGIQSAKVWEDNLGLQIAVSNTAPVTVDKVKSAQQFVHVETKEGSDILRVTKVASKIAARTGDIVEFTIRFDNLSARDLADVTIIDNLTRRLEYIADSASSTVGAEFSQEKNDGGSLLLRWKLSESLAPQKGGLVRFKCRVR